MQDWGPAELTRAVPVAPRLSQRAVGRAPRRDALADLLKAELVPHLAARGPAAGALAADPLALARLVRAGRADEARAALAARLASGACAQSVMMEDIGPAARELGRQWQEDECDFLDVTLATHELLRLQRGVAPEERARASCAPSLVLALAPGETHALGADIAASVFRCAGWRVLRCGGDEVQAALSCDWFDAAGFSVSCERYLPALGAAVAGARAAARNPHLAVLLGGPVLASRRGLAASLGADFGVAAVDVDVGFPGLVRKALRL